MTKAQNTITSPVTKRSKCSSIIAKCTAPFVAKQRGQVEQEIRLDEPFRRYAPGDSIKGAILLTVGKPLRITHLVIRLHGFVKVFNRARLPGDEISYDESLLSSGNGRGRRGTEYFGNGYARLFEDEEVLCGEGRVLGQYEFRFDLVLPSKHIPSSIDFEHGTISYLVTSTVTRPTAIAPTSVQHFKLNVQEVIDIAALQRPKPVALSMESIHKKGRPKVGERKKNMPSGSEGTSKSSSHDSANGLPTIHTTNAHTMEEPPRSPAPSEISSTTATTSVTSSNPTCLGEPISCTITKATEDIMTISGPNTVSVKTEVLQGGCLAGDHLPIRISIKHNKVVKSMQGIIITLYRQGRIDTHPAIPLGPLRQGEKRRYEDYYPKSRTGLGGLSLSSAGSSRSFRQDLAQIVIPIIIDPQSLTTIINTSIEAPPHLFPSITDVPGAMVNFIYYAEIVIDLRGKLSGQDRILPHLSMTSGPQHGYGDPKLSRWDGSDGVNYHSAPAFNYLITDQLRRTKGTICTKTEFVIGTRDSARKRGKQPEDRSRQSGPASSRVSVEYGREEDIELADYRDERHQSSREAPAQRQFAHCGDLRQSNNIPLPEPEKELDEKARMRRAEERLLPSAPPQDDDQPSSAAPIPSAPMAIDEEDFIHRYGPGAPAPAYDNPASHSTESGYLRDCRHQDRASTQDDKQELERQRLIALASSPESDAEEPDVTSATPGALEPTAPVLYEDDIFRTNDPRIPESSPVDSADDRITNEQLSSRQKSSTSRTNESESRDVDGSHEQASLADQGTRDNDDSHELNPKDDLATHDDDPPVYRR